jgi:hypothetical protein
MMLQYLSGVVSGKAYQRAGKIIFFRDEADNSGSGISTGKFYKGSALPSIKKVAHHETDLFISQIVRQGDAELGSSLPLSHFCLNEIEVTCCQRAIGCLNMPAMYTKSLSIAVRKVSYRRLRNNLMS